MIGTKFNNVFANNLCSLLMLSLQLITARGKLQAEERELKRRRQNEEDEKYKKVCNFCSI